MKTWNVTSVYSASITDFMCGNIAPEQRHESPFIILRNYLIREILILS
jgi:hypothetical protein